MFRFNKMTLALAALFALSLAAASTKAAPVAYLDATAFTTIAGSTTSNTFQGETVASPSPNYVPSLLSMGITFTASSGHTVAFVNSNYPNFGLAPGNTALFLNGSGGFLGSTLTITPLANTTAFGFDIKPSGDTTLPPGPTTTGEYTVTVNTNMGSFNFPVSSNDFNNFSFVGFSTTLPNEFITSIVIATTAGSTPLIDNLRFNGTAPAAAETPEPATMILFGTGLVGMASFARKRRMAADDSDAA